MIVELRHTFGNLYDNQKKPISLKDEIEVFKHVYKHIKEDHPDFKLKIIITGLKLLGQSHIKKLIDQVKESMKHTDLIAGIDLIHHEDLTDSLLHHAPDLLQLRNQVKDPQNLNFFLSSGETHHRGNQNLFDAVLLDSKRVSHGLQLFAHPHLVEKLKEKQACVEVCPISNMLLGHVNDLRNHPIRFLINRGLQISINSGHHGLFDYKDVSLDYLYAFLAWDLTLRDLKKISLNGIMHSSIDEKDKTHLKENVFRKMWHDFIEYVIENYFREFDVVKAIAI